MVPRLNLRVKRVLGVGLLAVVSLGISATLVRTAHRGAATASRMIDLSRFVERLQALERTLVRLTAIVELVGRGDGAFRDDLAREVRVMDALLTEVGQQASSLSATQRGFLRHLQQQWPVERAAIINLQQHSPESSAAPRAGLPETIRRRLDTLQRTGTVLREDCRRTLQHEASAAAAWPRRVGVRGAALILGMAGLAWLILPWTLAVRRLSRQLQQAAERLTRGELTSHLERPSDDELGELADAVNAATDALRRAQGEPTQLARRQHQAEERDRQLAATEDRLRHMERAHEAVRADGAQLRQALDDKTRELASLQHTLTSLEGERGRLQAELAHQQGALAQTQQTSASTQDALSSTQSELQWAQQTIVQLTGARDVLQAESAATRQELEQTRQQLEQSRQELEQSRAALSAARTEVQCRVTELEETRAALQNKLQQAQSRMEQQQQEPQRVEAALKVVKEELAAAQKQIQHLTSDLAEKTQALAEAQQAISKLQGRLGKQQAELTRRQEEVAKLQASLSTTKPVS